MIRLGRGTTSLLLVLAGLSAPLTGLAAEQPGTAVPSSPVSPGGMLQVLLGLIAVLGAVVATAWLLRRFTPGYSAMGGMLKVIGGMSVGPKERVVLVEIGDTWLLLGVAPGQVNALHSMPKPEDVTTAASMAHGVTESGFAAWLKQAVQRRQDRVKQTKI
jgi:flagellar protein FliO/FliZ